MKDYDMTSGSLMKKILLFSLPLMMSQVLQVFFNMADVAVVGKFASANALGSVGSTTILVTLFTGFLIGLGSGVNVVVAKHLGAKDHKAATQVIHTAFLICLAAGIIIAVLCLLLATPLLTLIKTKDNLIAGAVMYFRVYALGMPALGIFNFGNAVLSANGDTKRPLTYLTIAGVLNIVLNLFFVIVCNMAATGVALASIISQYVSAVLIMWHMIRDEGICNFNFKNVRIYSGRSRAILILGLSAGMQNAIFAIANLFIQVGINSFDSTIVAGNSAATNADTLIYNLMAAFYTACSTFMGQNLGAGNKKRVLKSYLISLFYSFATGALLGGLLFIFGREFLSFFTNSSEVIDAGMEKIKIMGLSYCVSAFMDCTIAASRGIGKSLVPTVIVIIGSCVFRVVWVYTIFAYFKTITSLYLLYVFSWAITGFFEIIYFIKSYRLLQKM